MNRLLGSNLLAAALWPAALRRGDKVKGGEELMKLLPPYRMWGERRQRGQRKDPAGQQTAGGRAGGGGAVRIYSQGAAGRMVEWRDELDQTRLGVVLVFPWACDMVLLLHFCLVATSAICNASGSMPFHIHIYRATYLIFPLAFAPQLARIMTHVGTFFFCLTLVL